MIYVGEALSQREHPYLARNPFSGVQTVRISPINILELVEKISIMALGNPQFNDMSTFSWDSIAEKTRQIYSQLLGRKI